MESLQKAIDDYNLLLKLSCELEKKHTEFVAEYKKLKAEYEEMKNDYIMNASILEAVEMVMEGKEVSDFMESFPIVASVKALKQFVLRFN